MYFWTKLIYIVLALFREASGERIYLVNHLPQFFTKAIKYDVSMCTREQTGCESNQGLTASTFHI